MSSIPSLRGARIYDLLYVLNAGLYITLLELHGFPEHSDVVLENLNSLS